MQHPGSTNKHNCLKLGPSPIGSKNKDMGKGVFDKVTLKLKNTPEANFLLEETEKYLKQQYKKIFDGSMQDLAVCPPKYDYGNDTRKRQRARAMQFVDDKLIKSRIQHLDQKTNPSIE